MLEEIFLYNTSSQLLFQVLHQNLRIINNIVLLSVCLGENNLTITSFPLCDIIPNQTVSVILTAGLGICGDYLILPILLDVRISSG